MTVCPTRSDTRCCTPIATEPESVTSEPSEREDTVVAVVALLVMALPTAAASHENTSAVRHATTKLVTVTRCETPEPTAQTPATAPAFRSTARCDVVVVMACESRLSTLDGQLCDLSVAHEVNLSTALVGCVGASQPQRSCDTAEEGNLREVRCVLLLVGVQCSPCPQESLVCGVYLSRRRAHRHQPVSASNTPGRSNGRV
jgi:hypothetical protein